MTGKQQNADKLRRSQLKKQEAELNYKPEEADPEAAERSFQAWRKDFLKRLEVEVFNVRKTAGGF